MAIDNPLEKPRNALDDVMSQIGSPNSPVGIDPLYTHAIIIDFLRQIAARIDAIEARLDQKQP